MQNDSATINRTVKSSHGDENGQSNCEQQNGMQGVCRSTRTCIRQQPDQKLWNVCEWSKEDRLPSMVCCFSEQQFFDHLLKETNSDQDFHDFDEFEDEDQDYEKPKCGISKFVSNKMPIQPKNRRSKDMLAIYDMLFPTAYRIVMGNSVRVGQIPWMVAIYNHDKFVCGGSIIDERHIITAAHCFEYDKLMSMMKLMIVQLILLLIF